MIAFELLPDGERFRCLKPLTWTLVGGKAVTVPEGYGFNISTPFARKTVAAFAIRAGWDWLLRAACIHDYLIGERAMRRPRAGLEFYRAMISGGGPLRAVAVLPPGVVVALWRFWA